MSKHLCTDGSPTAEHMDDPAEWFDSLCEAGVLLATERAAVARLLTTEVLFLTTLLDNSDNQSVIGERIEILKSFGPALRRFGPQWSDWMQGQLRPGLQSAAQISRNARLAGAFDAALTDLAMTGVYPPQGEATTAKRKGQ